MPKKKHRKLTQILRNRWLPNDTTRPIIFDDKKKKADKEACRNKEEW